MALRLALRTTTRRLAAQRLGLGVNPPAFATMASRRSFSDRSRFDDQVQATQKLESRQMRSTHLTHIGHRLAHMARAGGGSRVAVHPQEGQGQPARPGGQNAGGAAEPGTLQEPIVLKMPALYVTDPLYPSFIDLSLQTEAKAALTKILGPGIPDEVVSLNGKSIN